MILSKMHILSTSIHINFINGLFESLQYSDKVVLREILEKSSRCFLRPNFGRTFWKGKFRLQMWATLGLKHLRVVVSRIFGCFGRGEGGKELSSSWLSKTCQYFDCF